jgi:hypothetical protein
MYRIVKLFNTGTCEILLFFSSYFSTNVTADCFPFVNVSLFEKDLFLPPLINIQYTILPKRDSLAKIPKSRIIG